MALKDAEAFIKIIIQNNELRTSFYQYDSSQDKMKFIISSGFTFVLYEFEQSIKYLKTEAPDEEQAIMLDEILLWWNMQMYDGSITSEATSCTPAECASCKSCG